MNEGKYYIFYDGECGFCNHWVQWILRNDARDLFMFSALQSDFGQAFLRERGLETTALDTIYLWKPREYYLCKSAAITRIARLLGGRYGFFASLNILPVAVGDFFYDQIARRRNRLMPRRCIVPNEKDRGKFLNEKSHSQGAG